MISLVAQFACKFRKNKLLQIPAQLCYAALGILRLLLKTSKMTTSQQKVYLITESQRDALLSYLQERPYKEVAAGIEFLLNATTATLNAPSGDDDSSSVDSGVSIEPQEGSPE